MDGVHSLKQGDLAYVIIVDGHEHISLYQPSLKEVSLELNRFRGIPHADLMTFLEERDPEVYGVIFDIEKIREDHNA